MLMVAFMYSPCITTGGTGKIKPNTTERSEIMSSFYELELPDELDEDTEDLVNHQLPQQQHRRDIK